MQFSFSWVGFINNQLHCRKSLSWSILPSPSLVTRTSPKAIVFLLPVVELGCRCHLYGTSFLFFQGSHPWTFLLLWPGTNNTCNFILQLFFSSHFTLRYIFLFSSFLLSLHIESDDSRIPKTKEATWVSSHVSGPPMYKIGAMELLLPYQQQPLPASHLIQPLWRTAALQG